MGADNDARCGEQQSVSIGSGARHGFGADDGASTGPVLGHQSHTVSAADLLAEDAGENVGGAACGQRDDDLDCPPGLRAHSLSTRREMVAGHGRDSEDNRDAIQTRGATDAHFTLTTSRSIGTVVGSYVNMPMSSASRPGSTHPESQPCIARARSREWTCTALARSLRTLS